MLMRLRSRIQMLLIHQAKLDVSFAISRTLWRWVMEKEEEEEEEGRICFRSCSWNRKWSFELRISFLSSFVIVVVVVFFNETWRCCFFSLSFFLFLSLFLFSFSISVPYRSKFIRFVLLLRNEILEMISFFCFVLFVLFLFHFVFFFCFDFIVCFSMYVCMNVCMYVRFGVLPRN